MTITAKRIESDIHLKLTLKDGDVSIAWDTTDVKQVCMYSVEQHAFAGHCTFEVDDDDNKILNVLYPASEQLYLGDHRVVVRLLIDGDEATYDALAFTLKPTSDTSGSISTETVEVGIEVEEVDSTVLHEILAACQDATDEALEAAEEAREAAQTIDDKYTKPEDGIPSSDMTAEVQASLGKADTALQEHQPIKTVNGKTIIGTGDVTTGVYPSIVISASYDDDLGEWVPYILTDIDDDDFALLLDGTCDRIRAEFDQNFIDHLTGGDTVPTWLFFETATQEDTGEISLGADLTFTVNGFNAHLTYHTDGYIVGADSVITFGTPIADQLAAKANASQVYTKSETDTLLAGKVGSTDVTSIVKMSQADYDDITPDAHTLYIIV